MGICRGPGVFDIPGTHTLLSKPEVIMLNRTMILFLAAMLPAAIRCSWRRSWPLSLTAQPAMFELTIPPPSTALEGDNDIATFTFRYHLFEQGFIGRAVA